MEVADRATLTAERLHELLQANSRTFALSIPLLPPAERREVGLAYLVFRIADTLEDAELWCRDTRVAALERFVECLATADVDRWREFARFALERPPSTSTAYNHLLGETPRVLQAVSECDDEARDLILSHASRSAEGMAATLRRGNAAGQVQLDSLDQLRHYCYLVAGIVGELLTELLARRLPPGARERLHPYAPAFGEGLQLVNILRDAASDAGWGRNYVPVQIERAALDALARQDLQQAQRYTDTLRSLAAPSGYVAFTQLPLELALATLDRVASDGCGAKLSRDDVAALVQRVRQNSAHLAQPMLIRLASPRGFCAGVDMAIAALELALSKLPPPIYVFHEIVHNKWVVDSFRSRGVVFVDAVSDVPNGAVLVFSAHGVSPEVRQDARDRRLHTIDATCPLVTKVHVEAVRYAQQGYQILLVGHRGHDELVGTLGEAPDVMHVIETEADVDALALPDDARIAYLTQTTLSVDDARHVIERIKRRFPQAVGPSKDDICYATQNRQDAVGGLARDADVVLVVGSENSSNSQRLREVAERRGARAYLIDDARSLRDDWFTGSERVAITAGASAPEHRVQEVIAALVERFGALVESGPVRTESVAFPLPKELRHLATADAGAAASVAK